MIARNLLSFVLVSTLALTSAVRTCKRIKTERDLDLEKYVQRSWYIQRQQPNGYQEDDGFYCVVWTYDLGERRSWGRPAMSINNYGTLGAVDGEVDTISLCATRRNPLLFPGKLRVAPCLVPGFLGGPYWVAAVKDNEAGDDYEWAIVVGGQPRVDGQCEDGLCTTKEGCRFAFVPCNQGLWFVTRERIASAEVIAEMEAKALELGICTANMIEVIQDGCRYSGAKIKI